MRTIAEIAAEVGVREGGLRPYGGSIGKVSVSTIRELADRQPRGKLVLVTGVTPTSHGEGKTVTAIGTAMALRRAGHRAVVCLRQPSLGPVFGIKGGAAGGGQATVEPSDQINLGLTGDIHAVAAAHNLLSALLDNHLYHGNELGIDPQSVRWPRTVDMEDRSLRHIVTGTGGGRRETPRESSFVIAAASEVMAVLGLARDYADLKQRLGRILLGVRADGQAARANDLRAAGAMAALLRDALEPNLLQARDGTPALVHGGPFGNIAHGTCSRLSIELGLAVADYCVVEAGFATELGAEKFVDIVSRVAGFEVATSVLVATVRSLRHHGGVPEELADRANPVAVERGLDNLAQHVENLRTLGIEPVVSLNRFPGDTEEETERLRRFCLDRQVPFAVSSAFTDGAAGAEELAGRVVESAARGTRSRPVYPADLPIEQVLDLLVTRFYGGLGITVAPEARSQLEELDRIGETAGPVCVAKTALSLSDDPARIGRPKGFVSTLRRVSRSAGAGFTVAYLGEIETLPGLPRRPLAERIDLTADGTIVGLS